MRTGKGAGGAFGRIIEGRLASAIKSVGDWIRDTVVPWLTKLNDKMISAAGGTKGMGKTMGDLKPVFTVVKAVPVCCSGRSCLRFRF